ncbi:hypothetical protein DVH05_000628 [Phytophthora capsici]|nr:hypothetical protein DVH05_000628 [Phytophthora capsici]
MERLTELLDEKNVSLDEILAFVDSSDFNLPVELHDLQPEPIGFFDISMDIEDSLVLSQYNNPDGVQESQPSITQQIQIATTSGQNCNNVERSQPSRKPFQERGRVRDRVIRFRGMVKRLEQQLEDLNNSRLRAQEYDNQLDESAVNAEVQDKEEVVTWQKIAMRQFAARREAEKENLSLRESLEEQLRVAKRLENLIRGHQVPYDTNENFMEVEIFKL